MVEANTSNILTIDVEDWFQSSLEILGPRYRGMSESVTPSERVVINTRRLLHILAEYDVHATFFVLGSVAETYCDLVREIHAAGHEVACHGYEHSPVQSLTQTEFKRDVERAIQITKSVIQNSKREMANVECNILGYRAPYFSITPNSKWIFNVLMELDFVYDSSILQVRRRLYGLPKWNESLPTLLCQELGLREFPISTINLLGHNIPLGGGYFRLLPYPLIKQAISAINRQDKPAVFYLHPYALDPEELHQWLPGESLKARMVHLSQRLNRGRTEAKLRRLLMDFEWMSIREWMVRQR